MKRRIILVVLFAFAAGLLAYVAIRLAQAPTAPLANPAARIDWLTREFKLTPAQATEIDRLQSAYAPVCEAHCAAIARAEDALSAAVTESARATARAEMSRLADVCAKSTLTHLQAVASLMEPAQGARFLALMEPRVAHSAGRAGAPALDPAP